MKPDPSMLAHARALPDNLAGLTMRSAHGMLLIDWMIHLSQQRRPLEYALLHSTEALRHRANRLVDNRKKMHHTPSASFDFGETGTAPHK